MALTEFSQFDVALKLTARVVLPSGYNPGGTSNSNRIFSVGGWERVRSLQASSDPDPEPAAIVTKEVTIGGGGTTDLDLTDAPIIGAVDGSGNPTDGEDLTDSKLMACFFSTLRSSGTNAAAVTVLPHATNGYALWGSGNEVDIPADSTIGFFVENSSLPAVSSTAKVIQFSGTSGDKVRVILVFE